MNERFTPYLPPKLARELRELAAESATTPNKIIAQAVINHLNTSEAKKLMWEAARELREEGQAARENILDAARREREANRQLLQQLLDSFVQIMGDLSSIAKPTTTKTKPDGTNSFGIPVNK